MGGEENDPPKLGEVIYRDDLGVICRRWNWREGERTKITKDTKNAVVVIESIASIPIENAVEADRIFSILMGDDVEPRKQFIIERAHEAFVDI